MPVKVFKTNVNTHRPKEVIRSKALIIFFKNWGCHTEVLPD
jgi:hypothetical protein